MRLTFHDGGASYPHGFWTPYCRLHSRHATGSKCTKLYRVYGPLECDKDAALRAAKFWLVAECYYPNRQSAHVSYLPAQFEVPDDATLDHMGEALQRAFEAPDFELLRDDVLDAREKAVASRRAGSARHDAASSAGDGRLA